MPRKLTAVKLILMSQYCSRPGSRQCPRIEEAEDTLYSGDMYPRGLRVSLLLVYPMKGGS